MYTKILNVQIIVSLLKQHNIRNLVLSAGTRHVPLAHSVENDDFFHCYSVVDERSAGYFALGLAKELNEPVAIACTSSTATCNYTPPIAEAYYQGVPLLVLTGDRDPYRLDQLEDQMIDQVDMYRNFCKKCVNLPVVHTENDIWYCQRLVNEALLELDHHGKGPVQINFPINQTIEDIADASVPELPAYNKISRVDMSSPNEQWTHYVNELKKKKRIMVLCGSGVPVDDATQSAMNEFAERYNCVLATEHLSNLHGGGMLNTYAMAEAITGEVLRTNAPDLVIFFGGNFISRFKTMLRNLKISGGSWIINSDGRIMDPFQDLNTVFECTLEHFFRYFADHAGKASNNKELYNDFEALNAQIEIPEMKELIEKINQQTITDAKFKKLPMPDEKDLLPSNYLSALAAMYELSKRIPEKSLLHLSILNSTRIMQLFRLPEGVRVYSNVGTDGIDGSMSTFFGQAAVANKPSFLVIGDLSFFYDMNSLGIRYTLPNAHILLINNGGGSEFYFSMGRKLLPNIDLHICAAHKHSAKAWVECNGFRYLSASNMEEFYAQIDEFMNEDVSCPVVFELFTDKEMDVKVLKGLRRTIMTDTKTGKLVKQIEEIPLVQKLVETPGGQNVKNLLKSGFKKIF